MKKICFLVDSIYTLGGIQRVVTNIANILSDSYHITIICSRDVAEHKKVNYGLNKKINVITINNSSNFLFSDKCLFFPIRVLYYLDLKKNIFSKESLISKFIKYDSKFIRKRKLISYINSEKFDYVLAEGLSQCILLSMIKPKLFYCKTIGCWHASYDLYVKKNSVKLMKKSLNLLDHTVVLSNNDKELIKENFCVDVISIANPLLLNSKLKSNLTNKKFIAVGRYSAVKGYDRLIKSFKIFHQKNSDWKLDIVGEGPERNKLQKLIDESDLTNYIKLCGKVDNIDEYYSNSSCLLVTSRDEGFGLCLTEAMFFGLPIIAFDVPVFHEILPSNYNYIVEQGNFEEFANKMLEIATDFELRKRLGKILYNVSNKYNIDNIINEWIKVLD